MADKAWRGIIEASSTKMILRERINSACLEFGDILHVLVSTIGTGNLVNMCTVLPNLRRLPAIPVQAHAASLKLSARESDIKVLRPAPADAIMPYDIEKILGRTLKHAKLKGEHLIFFDFE